MSYIGSTLSHRLAVASLLAAFAGCATAGDDTTAISDDSTEVGLRGQFDLFVGDDAQYYFHLESGNGEILLASEGYTSREGALNGLLSVLDNGGIASRYAVVTGEDGQYYIHLRAGNGQVVGSSEAYPIYSHAARGIDACISAVATYLEHWNDLRGARVRCQPGGVQDQPDLDRLLLQRDGSQQPRHRHQRGLLVQVQRRAGAR